MAQDRVEYRVAGAALRATRKRATRAGLSPLEWRVLAVVTELTASWSKIEDSTSARQIGALVYDVAPDALSGFRRDRITRALRTLDDKGVIGYRPSGTGRGASSTVSLNPAPARRVLWEPSAPAPSTRRRRAGEHSAQVGTTEKAENVPDACGACAGSGWVFAPGSDGVRPCPECRGAA